MAPPQRAMAPKCGFKPTRIPNLTPVTQPQCAAIQEATDVEVVPIAVLARTFAVPPITAPAANCSSFPPVKSAISFLFRMFDVC